MIKYACFKAMLIIMETQIMVLASVFILTLRKLQFYVLSSAALLSELVLV